MTVRSVTNAPGLKSYLGVIAAVLTYLATQELLELPTLADVAINAVGVGLAVYLADPQPTVAVPDRNGQAGYGLVELVVVVLVILILVFVLLRVA